jgi:hypothetical protein
VYQFNAQSVVPIPTCKAMFVTRAQFEQHVPAGIAVPDNRYWRAVGLTLQTPWYLCVLQASDKVPPQTILVAWESDLQGLLTAEGDSSVVAIARLDIEGSNQARWGMRWVRRIWLAAHDELEETGCLVFQFDDEAAVRDEMLRILRSKPNRIQVFSSHEDA